MPLVLTYQANVADGSSESIVLFLFSSSFENNQANNYSNNK